MWSRSPPRTGTSSLLATVYETELRARVKIGRASPRLLTGAYCPDTGDVRIDGRPVHGLHSAERARLVAMVAQEGHVFARSIADNVRLALADPTDDDVRAALDAVDAVGWVDALPDELATGVGRRAPAS